MYFWARQLTPAQLCSHELAMCKEGFVDWSKRMREICADDLIDQFDDILIGGPGKVMEVDETHFFQRKYNQGCLYPAHGVLAMYAVRMTRFSWWSCRDGRSFPCLCHEACGQGEHHLQWLLATTRKISWPLCIFFMVLWTKARILSIRTLCTPNAMKEIGPVENGKYTLPWHATSSLQILSRRALLAVYDWKRICRLCCAPCRLSAPCPPIHVSFE